MINGIGLLSFYSILRAMFEICPKCPWAVPAKAALLNLCKMVEKRMCVSIFFYV